ncbi:MAG TPA: PEP-CTERM sorting domain-containing protein [Roseiarcus sp.]|nr:PEP-CTERM sorting domain-containing protein [Roseiarcus sp.]
MAAFGAKANAAVISVTDPYFDQFPAGQNAASYLNFKLCGTACAFSDSATVGWTQSVTMYTRSADAGQWQTGVPQNTITFNSDPMINATTPEPIVLRAINATASQVVSTTAVAGVTYTLDVDLGFAITQLDNASVFLIVDGHKVLATASPSDGLTLKQMQGTGNWYDFEASYTATAADVDAPIEILLSSLTNGMGWGFFGNVRLTDSLPVSNQVATPEPATWAMMLIGFGGMAGVAAVRRRRSTAVQLV